MVTLRALRALRETQVFRSVAIRGPTESYS